MGGGGSDNYEATQAKEEAKRQQARDALNVYFGVAPTTKPEANSYITRTPTRYRWQEGDGGDNSGQIFDTKTDTGGYSNAQNAYDKAVEDAAKNKSDREALYTTVRGDAFTAGKRGLDETKTTAERQNKFALFAQGLNGGSEDIDQSALLGRVYSKGLLDLGSKADAAKADLQSSDEQTRLGLLQSIDAGMDQGSALSSALAQMKNNSDRAAAEAAGIDLGDLFANSGALYTKSQAAQGQNAARQYWANYFSTNPKAFGGGGGIVTSTGGP